jgi:hypothetical protein
VLVSLAGSVGTAGSLPGTPANSTLPAASDSARAAGAIRLAGTLPLTPGRGARERLLGMLASGQGVVRGCQTEIGRALGVSRARVRQLLDDLAAIGMIIQTSSRGTVISLMARVAPRPGFH